ncbi:MAG: hypothetical protein SPK80_04050 [Bacteroidales bacterium]|nr:hypothetical protein [Bacteroidales bacterium]
MGRGRHDLWRVDSACASRVRWTLDGRCRPSPVGTPRSGPDEQRPATWERTGGRASVKGEDAGPPRWGVQLQAGASEHPGR